ncbi:hypothetical protein IW261DRAFT_1413114 [Armillaria novae-zelandiae]|uniref:Uncharacterized protein n=1 Tax=Armillaria novae-zelandiae TaxID=153914 RepID=A0AA39US76_9AGAR|nr:hypothetical protein IW261DRAFT_1413114 [Armillaria novae-zelandiae]
MSQASTIQFPSRDPSPAPEYHELYHDYNSDASSVSSSSSSFRRRRRRAGVVGADAVRAVRVSLSSTASSDSGQSDQSESEPEVEQPAVPIPTKREEKRAERPRGRRVSRKPKVVKLRIELHLEIELTMKATIRGDITISLLDEVHTWELVIASQLTEYIKYVIINDIGQYQEGLCPKESAGPSGVTSLKRRLALEEHQKNIRAPEGLSKGLLYGTYLVRFESMDLAAARRGHSCLEVVKFRRGDQETINILSRDEAKRRPKVLFKEKKESCSLRVSAPR